MSTCEFQCVAMTTTQCVTSRQEQTMPSSMPLRITIALSCGNMLNISAIECWFASLFAGAAAGAAGAAAAAPPAAAAFGGAAFPG